MMQFCSLQCTIGYSSELLWNFHKQFSIPWFMTRRLEPKKHSEQKGPFKWYQPSRRMAGHHYLFMSSEAANLNANAVWMAKNKREKGLNCLQGLDKTRFPDFPKCHLMFWTTGVSWGMLYLQLQPKNRKFYEVLVLAAFENWEQTGFFWVDMVPDTKWRSIFK